MSATVHGGAAGLSARTDDMVELSRVYDEVGDDLRSCAARLAAVVLGLSDQPELVVAAVLSPATAARAAYETGDAAGALVPLAVTTEGAAAFLRMAAESYRAADAAMERAAQGLQDTTGFALGVAAPGLAFAALAGYGGSRVLEEAAEGVGWDAGARGVRAGRDGAAGWASSVLLDHPGAVEHVVGGAAGLQQGLLAWLPPGARQLVDARLGYPRTYEEVLASIGLLFPDGRPVLGRGGQPQPGDERAPATVRELLDGVDRRQGPLSVPGEIGVVQLRGADGQVRWVVQLPGTQSWALRPGELARDTGTNVHTMAGASTVYMRGVHEALARAGVGADDPVMLVGHSQGGMTAAALAADVSFRESFSVTHVVTAGSPIARTTVPHDVQVLALENVHDLVPRLDGQRNESAGNVTTVTFDAPRGSVGGNHALPHYKDLAGDLPGHASVARWQASAGGFLDDRNVLVRHDHERQAISRELP